VASPQTGGEPPTKPRDFVLEVGTEELPAADVASARAQLEAAVPAMLAAARLEHGEVHVGATPRRLVVTVTNPNPDPNPA